MVDMPRGYSPEFLGRMTMIYTLALMARAARKDQSMDILVHDKDRSIILTHAIQLHTLEIDLSSPLKHCYANGNQCNSGLALARSLGMANLCRKMAVMSSGVPLPLPLLMTFMYTILCTRCYPIAMSTMVQRKIMLLYQTTIQDAMDSFLLSKKKR